MRVKAMSLLIWSLIVLVSTEHSESFADSIWLVENDQPLYGIVKSENAESIVFHQTTDGVQFNEVVLPKSQVETVVINFDRERLSRLSPDNLLSYVEYAEELQSQKKDPVARQLAIRLLVIAAGNSSEQNLRRSSLSQLVTLARSDTESAIFQKLLYLETGIRTTRVYETKKITSPQANQARARTIELVKRIRQGVSIAEQFDDAQLKETVEQFESVCSWSELVQISRSNRINNQQLRRLVELEDCLRRKKSVDQNTEIELSEPWNLLAKRIGTKDVVIPRIETVTEFDPTEALFAEGKWIKVNR